MDVHEFTDEYELVAPLYGVQAEALRQRDLGHAPQQRRWFACEAGRAVGAVSTWLRPDDRLFLMFRVEGALAYRPLVSVVDAAMGRSLSTIVDEEESVRVDTLLGCGFKVETVGERFRLRFAEILGLVARAWVPSGYAIRSVSDVDQRKASALDNAIRHVVPGSDGWAADEAWFADELRSPEFDPDAYLIAVHEDTGSLVGLLRIWRNPDGPRLGLIGVLPDHRSGPLAAALLKQGLGAASEWGYDSFVTETSPSNSHIYPRMARLNAERLGSFLQLVRG